MNEFDRLILLFFNQYARDSKLLDFVASAFQENTFLKGGVLTCLFCYAWFKTQAEQKAIRISLTSTLIACFLSVFIARLLAISLPFRPRPIFSECIDFVSPYFMQKVWYEHMSAFPSDHAALYGALSIGIFFATRTIGLIALLYTGILVLIPRIYTGMHHPTDIIAGVLIALFSVYFVNRPWFVRKFSTPILGYSEQYSGLFYVAYFVILLQISTLFIGIRNVCRMLIQLIKLSL